MPLIKVLITVKTYPTLSNKYDELVCTAGFRDNGDWIRIYPMPFRKLDYEKRYKKYQWIELNLIKNKSDFRPESYRPTDFKNITFLNYLNTDKGKWTKRKQIVLKKEPYTNLEELIKEAKDKKISTSLAVFKPSKILDFYAKPDEREWNSNKLKALEAKAAQIDLFADSDNPFKVVSKLPYKFYYKFQEESGKERNLMIEDWEVGGLYWNALKSHKGSEEKAISSVKEKFLTDFLGKRDVYFYLGTTQQYHYYAPNPFIIVGVFYPMLQKQHDLF